MPPPIAAALFTAGILGLFWLDRDKTARVSKALWIPLIWFAIACSRPVGAWLQMGSYIDTADQMQEGSPLDRLVWLVLLVFGLIVIAGRKRAGKSLLENRALLFFFLYCVVSFLWSDFPDVAFKRWIKAIGDVIMVLIVLTDREPVAAFNWFMSRLTYVLIPLSILFIKYYPSIGVSYFQWGGKANIGGVTTNKNSLGVISLYFGLWAFWRLLDVYRGRKAAGRTRHMVPYAVILGMVFWLFHASNSMTSLNSFLMGAILLVVAGTRMAVRRPGMVHALMVSMLVVTASVLFLGASPDVLRALGRNPTLTDRTEIWGVVLKFVQNPLLGTGFESFWLGPRLEKMWRLYWWHPQEAHNGYLEIYLMLGWVGIVFLGAVIASGYRTVFKGWRGNTKNTLWLAYFFVGLVYNCTEAAFFRMQAVSWLFFLFAIVTVPIIRQKVELQERDSLQHSKPLQLQADAQNQADGWAIPVPRHAARWF